MKVKVISDKFVGHDKGTELTNMHPTTAKALIKKKLVETVEEETKPLTEEQIKKGTKYKAKESDFNYKEGRK